MLYWRLNNILTVVISIISICTRIDFHILTFHDNATNSPPLQMSTWAPLSNMI